MTRFILTLGFVGLVGCVSHPLPPVAANTVDREAELASEEDNRAQLDREILVQSEIDAVCDLVRCGTQRKQEVFRVCSHQNAVCDVRRLLTDDVVTNGVAEEPAIESAPTIESSDPLAATEDQAGTLASN